MSDDSQQFNLRWRNHRKNFFDELENLFKTDLLTDINLILEGGRVVPCHKMVLATTSLAFRDFLLKNPDALDMIIPGVTYDQMRTLLEYMYSGQVQIMNSELSGILKVAEMLKIKGLTSEEDRSTSPTSSHVERTPVTEEKADSPPPTISTSTNDQTENKPAESSVASPPPPAHSTGNMYDFYKYSAAYGGMPAFPSLTHFPMPQYAAAMAAAASEYYGSIGLDKFKDTPILRNVLHQHAFEDGQLANSAMAQAEKEQKPVVSRVSSCSDDEKRGEEKPKNSPYYKVKKELMERVQQQQQQQQCQSSDTSSTPAKSGKQKVDWKRYKQYSPDDLNRAITAVIDGEMSALKASQIFSVPSRTLYDKIKRLKNQQGGQNGSPGMRLSSDNESACFPYGIGRNVNGRIYKRNSYSPMNFSKLLTPENLSLMGDDCVGQANMATSAGSDAMSNSSNSPPAWQQPQSQSEDEPPRYNMSPAHSSSSRHSNSDCEMAEDLSVKKSMGVNVKEEVAEDSE